VTQESSRHHPPLASRFTLETFSGDVLRHVPGALAAAMVAAGSAVITNANGKVKSVRLVETASTHLQRIGEPGEGRSTGVRFTRWGGWNSRHAHPGISPALDRLPVNVNRGLTRPRQGAREDNSTPQAAADPVRERDNIICVMLTALKLLYILASSTYVGRWVVPLFFRPVTEDNPHPIAAAVHCVFTVGALPALGYLLLFIVFPWIGRSLRRA
jgi:hypothetical protein